MSNNVPTPAPAPKCACADYVKPEARPCPVHNPSIVPEGAAVLTEGEVLAQFDAAQEIAALREEVERLKKERERAETLWALSRWRCPKCGDGHDGHEELAAEVVRVRRECAEEVETNANARDAAEAEVERLKKDYAARVEQIDEAALELSRAESQRDALRAALRRFRSVCESGNARGRAMDLVPRVEWERFIAALKEASHE